MTQFMLAVLLIPFALIGIAVQTAFYLIELIAWGLATPIRSVWNRRRRSRNG